MWILKNSKLGPSPPALALKHLISLPSTTTIPHSKLKDKLRELVQLCFIKKNGQCRYKYLVVGRDRSYFVKKLLWFYQKVGIPIGTNFAPLLADLFLYSYKADFIQGLLTQEKLKEASPIL